MLFYFITHTPHMRPTIYNIYAIFHSLIMSITTIYYTHIYYLTTLILFTPFYFIAYIPPIRSIVCNSYAISHLVIIIIIIVIIQPPPSIYYTNIFTTQYNLTYTHCNSCPPYTFTNQILSHSLQLAAMIICPTANETNVYTFITHFRHNQHFKFLAWFNLKTYIHTLTRTPTPIYPYSYNHT